MARDDVFRVRNTAFTVEAEGNQIQAMVNRSGIQVVVDFFTQLVLSGYAYHVQWGTEDAPINTTTSIDDQLAQAVVDNNAGYATIPLHAEHHVATWTTSTIVLSMLEVDKDKIRYSSGGTAFVPANLRGDDPYSFAGAAYVGTDVTIAAKSAVPNSVELARKVHSEDAIGTAVGADFAPFVYDIRQNAPIVLVDASSIVQHFGAATADATGYGNLQFAQLAKTLLI